MNARTITAFAAPLLGLLLSLPASAAESILQPFSATYSSSYGILRASGERNLNAGDNGEWRLEHSARLLLVEVAESARFTLQEGRVTPLDYQFTNPLSGNRNSRLEFDWEQGVAVDSLQDARLTLRPAVYDKLSYQVQLKLDVCAAPTEFRSADYTVVDRDRLKTYRVTPVKEELLGTELGPLHTLRLRQVRADKKDDEPTYIWLAVDWQCLLVRLDQTDDGKALSLKITGATINGKPVTGTR